MAANGLIIPDQDGIGKLSGSVSLLHLLFSFSFGIFLLA
jgi:hypothetical protein